jgi:hypothetical protein
MHIICVFMYVCVCYVYLWRRKGPRAIIVAPALRVSYVYICIYTCNCTGYTRHRLTDMHPCTHAGWRRSRVGREVWCMYLDGWAEAKCWCWSSGFDHHWPGQGAGNSTLTGIKECKDFLYIPLYTFGLLLFISICLCSNSCLCAR